MSTGVAPRSGRCRCPWPTKRRHHLRRYRLGRPRQLPRFPVPCHLPVADPHPRLPEYLLRRQPRLFGHNLGGRGSGHAPVGLAIGRSGRPRQSPKHHRHQGPHRQICGRHLGPCPAASGVRRRRPMRPAPDVPYRRGAADLQRNPRPAASRRHPDPLLPPRSCRTAPSARPPANLAPVVCGSTWDTA